MVLVCPQWDAIEAAYKEPRKPIPLTGRELPITLYLRSLVGRTGTTQLAVYDRTADPEPHLSPELVSASNSVVGVVFRDYPDHPQTQSLRIRLRLVDNDGTVRVASPYIYCGGMQTLNQAVIDAVARGQADGYAYQATQLSPAIQVTAHLWGVTRGANMRAQPWWNAYVAVYGFAPADQITLPEGFVFGLDSVHAHCLLERPDDADEPCLCRLSPITLNDGWATLHDTPMFYRSTIC